MKDVIRIVLIDPGDESRDKTRRLLGSIDGAWVVEALDGHQNAGARLRAVPHDVAILSLDREPDRALELLAEWTRADPNAPVLPMSWGCESTLILRAIRAGAREFLALPAGPSEVLDVLARMKATRAPLVETASDAPRIISVTAASGGAGATTVALNLAASLANVKDRETLLLDFDLYFGDIGAMLDINTRDTLHAVLQNFERLDQTLLKRSMTRHSSGLYVLPHPVDFEEADQVSPDVLRQLIGLLKTAFSTLVIDTSKGLQPPDSTAFAMSDIILVVLQLDLLSVRNTARLLQLFRQNELSDRIRLVVNRAGSNNAEISLKKAVESLKMPVSWQIPNSTRIFQEARIHGAPVADVAKGSRPHHVFLEMAGALRPIAPTAPDRQRKGFFAAFF